MSDPALYSAVLPVAEKTVGYEGEQAALTTPIKHVTGPIIGHRLTADQRTVNLLRAAIPRPGRRRQLPAQDDLEGASPDQPSPSAHRRDHRRPFSEHHQHRRAR